MDFNRSAIRVLYGRFSKFGDLLGVFVDKGAVLYWSLGKGPNFENYPYLALQDKLETRIYTLKPRKASIPTCYQT